MGSSRRGAAHRVFGPALVFLLLVLAAVPAAAEDQRVLLGMLSADSFRVRARAALPLAPTGNAEAIAGLETAPKTHHPAVRAAAALALGEMGPRRCVPAL